MGGDENDRYVRLHLIENCKAQPVRKDYVGQYQVGAEIRILEQFDG